MTRDAQAHYADVNLTGDLDQITNAQLGAIDLLASLLTGETGWRVRVEIDPGTVIVATPPVTPDPLPPERPSEAPLSPQESGETNPVTPTPDSPTDGQPA